jgi:thioredoxin reductase (NADPH)
MVEDEVTIIGAGPAGMSAAIYLQRAGLSPVLLERAEPGGLLRSANWVENYPGFPAGIPGRDLATRFKDQLRQVGAKVTSTEVRSVKRVRWGFQIKSGLGDRTSRAVILATGTRPAKVAIRGASELAGKRVFSELNELPSSLKGKRLIIIGGGDAAFDYALGLRERGAQIVVVSRSEPCCLPLLRDRTEALGIEVVIGASPRGVRRTKDGLILTCDAGGSEVDLAGDMLLMACGRVPNIEVLGPSLRRGASASRNGLPETRVRGLFLAGDVVRDKQRQTGIAVGDGIRAAMLAEEYLGGR